MILPPGVVQSIDKNKIEIWECWLTSSIPVWSLGYGQELAQPISISAAGLGDLRFSGSKATIEIREEPDASSRVVWSGVAVLVEDPASGGGGGTPSISHTDLLGRSALDSHPITAITGLADALAEKAPAFVSDGAHLFWATPAASPGLPSLRALVAADLPALDTSKITTGTFANARIASAPTWNAKLGTSNVSGYANEVAAFVGANTVNGDSGLKRYQTGGITTKLGLGTSEVVDAFFAVQCKVGGTSAYRHYQGNALRFQEILRTDGSWALQAHDAYDALIDAPITVGNGSGGTIALGGGGRPVNLTGGSSLQISGATANKLARFDASKNLVSYDLVAADIPALDAAKITTGTFADARIASAATWNAKLSPSAVSGVAGNIAIFSGANSVSDNIGLYFDGTGLWCDGYIHGGGFKVGGSNFVDASRNIINGGSGTFSGALWGYGLRSTGNVTIDTGYALVVDSVTRIGATGIGNLLKLQVNSTDVVGARKSGWTAASGTGTRATFATNTVTTEQLAERVKALLDDLISHGLIGT